MEWEQKNRNQPNKIYSNRISDWGTILINTSESWTHENRVRMLELSNTWVGKRTEEGMRLELTV